MSARFHTRYGANLMARSKAGLPPGIAPHHRWCGDLPSLRSAQVRAVFHQPAQRCRRADRSGRASLAAVPQVEGERLYQLCPADRRIKPDLRRSEEHTSELQSLMRISYAVFCLKKKKKHTINAI